MLHGDTRCDCRFCNAEGTSHDYHTIPWYTIPYALVFVRWWVDQIWEFPEQWQLPGDPIHSRSTSTLIINSRYFLFHILLLNQKCSIHQKKLLFFTDCASVQSSSLLYQSDLTLHAIKRSPAAANLKQLPNIFHPICPQKTNKSRGGWPATKFGHLSFQRVKL